MDEKRPPNPLNPPMVETDEPVLTYQRSVGKIAALAAPYAVHGCTTGRWSGKGTAKENRPRSIT